MEQSSPAMTPDDPRLRDWVAGRLSPAAAAEVERIVRGSPALTRAVDDLRAAMAAAGGVAEDDVKVAAEWRQIERERIAAERSEAREDIEALPRDAGGAAAVRPPRPRTHWPLAAMLAALAAGVLVAVAVNRQIDAARKRDAAALDAERRATAAVPPVAAESAADFAATNQPPPVSAANAPPEGLGVRVRLRDGRARLLLEELLADSELRIGSGADDRDEVAAERLTARGAPAAIDALLNALARRPDQFSLEAVSVAAAGAADRGPDAAETAPGTVLLVLEIIDESSASPAGSGGPGTR
jgi:hypothetical protein